MFELFEVINGFFFFFFFRNKHPANRPTSRTKHNPDKRAISLYASILLRKCPNDVTVWKTEFKCSLQLLSPKYAEV
ncbi:hypothetical protein D917_04879 [Trichinella nativa]|uniref:Uncharacterized protein n=1 Tax=Trichinella nativa TaxID=6335 RepID=A0A1Y3EYW8_9BILA|nr:hypothetical protein D917_04879 [Trichinella nativa]